MSLAEGRAKAAEQHAAAAERRAAAAEARLSKVGQLRAKRSCEGRSRSESISSSSRGRSEDRKRSINRRGPPFSDVEPDSGATNPEEEEEAEKACHKMGSGDDWEFVDDARSCHDDLAQAPQHCILINFSTVKLSLRKGCAFCHCFFHF